MVVDNTLFTLLLVLGLGLIIPELFRKSHVPFLTLIILAGAITGPHGLDYIQANDTISFFGFLGMAFLMFMAGLETNITKIYKLKNKIFLMAFLNSLFPFLVGLTITRLFGYSWLSSTLIGIIFISSSVAVIASFLRNNKFISKDVSQLILSAVMVSDIISLVALGFILQTASPITALPLPVYFIVLIFSLFVLFRIIPFATKKIMRKRFFKDYSHERRLRFVIIVLLGVLVYFSFLGAHPILASFLAGISLSGIVIYEKSETLKHKLNAIGYGLFIPVFFFVVGMDIDISMLQKFDFRNVIMIFIILGLIISKFFSGYIAGRISKLSKRESSLFGSISITKLTSALAITYAASSLDLLDPVLVTTVILLAVITTVLGPTLFSYISRRSV